MKGKLISLVTLFLCMMGSLLLHAQSVQQGKVLEYQGSAPKTPLAGVSIAAKGAATVQSNAEGQFSLDLRTHHAGDAIQFRRVELNGYEVMNQEALEAARVARDFNDNANLNPNSTSLNVKPSTLNVIMIKRENLLKLRDGYRSVAAQRYKQQLKASTEEIERLMKAGQLAEEQYNERMNALEEAYEDKLTKLETYIDKFARIDLSDLDQDEQQIIDLVQAGNFDEALDLYDKQNLADRLRQSREDQQKLVAMRDQLSVAAQKKAMENERLRQSIDRHVTLLRMAGGIENLKKVHHILQETYLADTTSWKARKEYAVSLRAFGQTDEMYGLLLSGINIEKDDFAKGIMMVDLMEVLWQEDRCEEAYSYSRMIERLMTPLTETNYQVKSRALPRWCNVQIKYHYKMDELNQCRRIVDWVRENWAPDTLSYRSLDSYVALLSTMTDLGDRELSLWCAQESVRLGKLTWELNPRYDALGEAYATAASTYSLEGMGEELRESARKCAVQLEERLRTNDTRTMFVESSTTYYQLIYALVSADEYHLADSIINTRFARQSAEYAGLSHVETMRVYAGLLGWLEAKTLVEKDQLEEAERCMHNAFRLLDSSEEGKALSAYMRSDLKSRIALKKGKLKEAESECQEALKIHQTDYEESPDVWNADELCRSYLLLTEIYMKAGEKMKMKKALAEAEKNAAFPINRLAIERTKENIK